MATQDKRTRRAIMASRRFATSNITSPASVRWSDRFTKCWNPANRNHPMAVADWATTARYGRRAIVFLNSTPAAFKAQLRDVLSQVGNQSPAERIVFLKSWNEWAEGNYLEPDQKFGHGYLDVIRDEMQARSAAAPPAEKPLSAASR